MKRALLTAGFSLVLAMFAPSAIAACWSCGSDDCCNEAPQNTTGYRQCSYNTICLSGQGCACYSCQTSGLTCAGTGPAQCENPMGICEENQTFMTVPHGDDLDVRMLVTPPVSNLIESGVLYQGGACATV